MIVGAALALSTAVVHADSYGNGESGPIEGTWVVTIDPPGPVPPTHISVASYIKGGVAIGLADIYLPPNLGVMGNPVGSWTHVRGREYASTIVAFTYNTSGQATNMVKINLSVTLTSNDRFEGSSQLQVCDLQLVCAPLGPGLAQVSGRRLEVEPIQ